MLSPLEQARGLLLGLALGDALGWPVEFLDLSAIQRRYGPAGILEPPAPAIYTDDTQMTIALAQGLLEAGPAAELDAQMAAVGRRFIAWSHDPETPLTAPGATCLRGVANLEAGRPWRAAGVDGSKGCGACMRVAAAWLVRCALRGVAPASWPAETRSVAGGLSAEFDAALERVVEALGWDDERRARDHIGPVRGGGWIAEEAVALALYCAARQPDDFAAAVRLGANITGDSDSVAAIAGGLVGARLGPAGLPAAWLARLRGREGLEGLAQALARASQEGN